MPCVAASTTAGASTTPRKTHAMLTAAKSASGSPIAPAAESMSHSSRPVAMM
ncbi:MAG: hypothetical protein ACJLS2_12800 [Microcella pacifica]